MANGEPHGFVFDHVGRQPSSSRPLRSPGADAGRSARSRSSFRISSLRSALFSTAKNGRDAGGRKHGAGGASVDKTPTSGVFSSVFGRQADGKLPPGGDLWVDVDLHRPAWPSPDDMSVTSSDWTAPEAAAAVGWRPELDRSSTVDGGGHVAVVRRSNSARPATRRPLPMRVCVAPEQRRRGGGGDATTPCGATETEPPATPVCVRDADLWTRRVNSTNSARLSDDSGHVSCKLSVF